jgi:exopolysaccharide biosynthesis polyprenyl glycosylphosphotransferase
MQGFRASLAEASVIHRHLPMPSTTIASDPARSCTINAEEAWHEVVSREKRYRAEELCRLGLVVSDSIVIIGACLLAYYVRFDLLGRLLPPESFLAPSGQRSSLSYWASILSGAALLVMILFLNGAYQNRALLRFRHSFFLIVKSLLVWIVVFCGISLILEFDERLSRIYMLISLALLLVALVFSRFAVQRVLLTTKITSALRQRILFVDWTDKTAKIARAALRDRWNPYELVACAPNAKNQFTRRPPAFVPALGSYHEVRVLCEKGLIDIVILGDGRRSEEDVMSLARECEKAMVDFVVIPSGFHILLSGLELTTISGVPVLGVTKLPLNNPINWMLKRAIDVVGAMVGLVLSAPVIAVFGLLVYLESPGPIFYRQIRVGRRGRHFQIIKIRSMKLSAEKNSGARWATKNDDRRLKIGAFMRRWNIDELPQFWNVLKGDLSLVGPRPERPELIKRFREEVLYYNARHNIIPGMTGWAQVNGFRGNTDLNERIRCDIYYIENWNPILDFQIMFMTFFCWEGAH